jgi:futalosine hydrolase
MKILLVSATDAEVAQLGDLSTDILVTGVGMVATAAWCARRLAEQRYDVALNVGLCGSFDPGLPPGTVVHVVSDRIAELGAEDGDAFIRFEDMQLPGGCAFANHAPPRSAALDSLPRVSGITVNTVHGADRSIAAVVARFAPQVESMEGAAFMYACGIHRMPYAQVRAVSNIVERRNRAAWRLSDAVANLSTSVRAILKSL